MRRHVPLAPFGVIRPILLRHLPVAAAPREAQESEYECLARVVREGRENTTFSLRPRSSSLARDLTPALSAHHLASHGIDQVHLKEEPQNL